MSIITESCIHTFQAEGKEILKLVESMDLEVLEKAVQVLLSCKGRVLTSGCGTSSIAARKVNHILNCIGTPSVFMAPSDALHGSLGGIREDDVAILVSKGGGTQELVKMMESLKAEKAFTIVVSENEDSPMAKLSNLFIRVKVEREPDAYNILATASTLAVISVFDAICLAITSVRGFNKEVFHIVHPGGAVGERLTGKVLFEEGQG